MQWVKLYQEKVWSNMRKLRDKAGTYGVPFVSKFFLKDYGSGTNQMGGFVGGLHFCKWPILGGFIDFIVVFHVLRVKSKISFGTIASSLFI